MCFYFLNLYCLNSGLLSWIKEIMLFYLKLGKSLKNKIKSIYLDWSILMNILVVYIYSCYKYKVDLLFVLIF